MEKLLEQGQFSKQALGGRTGADSAKEGFFFTDNKAVARSYGVDEENMVIPDQWELDQLLEEKAGIGDWDKINSDKDLWEEQLGNLDASYEELVQEQIEVLNERGQVQAQVDKLEAQYENTPESMLFDIDTQIDPLLEKLDDLDNEIADFTDEMEGIDADREDVKSDIQGAEDDLKKLEELDDEIKAHEENAENAIYEFQDIDTVDVHLIMQNPMIIGRQESNLSLTRTIRNAKEQGYDGVILKDIHDPYLPLDPSESYIGTHYIVFEPGQIVNAETQLPMGDIPNAITMLNLSLIHI